METMNERRAKIAAMTHAEIADLRDTVRMQVQTQTTGQLECPFCGTPMNRTIKPYPTSRVVWECHNYLKNEWQAWWATDQSCGVIITLDGKIEFGFGKEYLA